MPIWIDFEQRLPVELRTVFQSLNSPMAIQEYLDSIAYVGEERDRAPFYVMTDRQCHCLDGGLFAALALRRLGEPGWLVDLVPWAGKNGEKLDEDHVLAVFRRNGCWGAIAKANYVGLRYREPVYRSLRELAMSYFETYYNVNRVKTLRGYTRIFDISRFDGIAYAWDEAATRKLYKAFYRRKSIPLISEASFDALHLVDQRSFDAGTLGGDWNWFYKPGSH